MSEGECTGTWQSEREHTWKQNIAASLQERVDVFAEESVKVQQGKHC